MYNTDLPTRAELPSSRRLIRSTLIALVTAGVLLVTTVLPAEYGIDALGIGRMLGLTQMGQIKASLAAETAQPASPPVREAATPVALPPAAVASARVVEPATPESVAQTDQIAVTLKPGQAAEVKLDMRKGAKVAYRWTTSGGAVNFDAHGDPPNAAKNFYHGYGKGRQVERDEGVLEAAFDGRHGWFWRNRSQTQVTVTLATQGEYTAIKRVL